MWKSDSGFYLIMLSDTSYQQERLCISLSVCTQNRIFEHKIDKLKTELVTNKQWVICDTKKKPKKRPQNARLRSKYDQVSTLPFQPSSFCEYENDG